MLELIKQNIRENKFKHAWVFLYVLLYAPWFMYLEQKVSINSTYSVIHSKLDDLIPFIEVFVIPYIFWFAFVAIFIALFFFISKDEFYKLTSFMFIGMTICLIIYTIYPNGHDLRVTEFTRNNIFIDLVKQFYTNDTCTNVLPSIHSFNSIVIAIAVCKSDILRTLKHYNLLRLFTIISTILIMASTVFIKQHSIIDMIAAIVLSAAMYPFIYLISYNTKTNDSKIIKTNN